MLTINLPKETEAHLMELASKTGKPTDELIANAIANLMEDLEDYTAILEYEENRKNETLISLDDVLKENDLAN